VAGFNEHDKDSSYSVKRCKFLNQQRHYQLLKEDLLHEVSWALFAYCRVFYSGKMPRYFLRTKY
jgi:hypothetical protein